MFQHCPLKKTKTKTNKNKIKNKKQKNKQTKQTKKKQKTKTKKEEEEEEIKPVIISVLVLISGNNDKNIFIKHVIPSSSSSVIKEDDPSNKMTSYLDKRNQLGTANCKITRRNPAYYETSRL